MFMDWIAPPAVPLARLSIAPIAMTLPARGSSVAWTCSMLAPSTALVCGQWPSGSTWMNGSSAYALRYAARTSSAVTPSSAGAETVARMPRDIGARIGVNETVGRVPETSSRFCSISGVCRWTPPTPYALAWPIISEPSRCGLSDLPAPEAPVGATTVMSGAISPAASAGMIVSVDAVGKQPGTAMRLAPASTSRCPGSSGRPYGQVPAWSPP